MKLTDSISRVCLMLDPEIDTHAELMKALEAVRSAAFSRDTKDPAQFDNAVQFLRKSGWTVVSQVSSGDGTPLTRGSLTAGGATR
jgi:hypothetical protein